MRTILILIHIVSEDHSKCAQKSNKSLSRQGSGPSLTERVAELSLFLHRTSAVRVNLFAAATVHGPLKPESASLENLNQQYVRE